MNISIINCILFLVLYFICLHKRNRSKSTFITWCCIILGLESGLRHISVGPDTATYYFHFKDVCDFSWGDVLSNFLVESSEFRDPAYNLIQKIFISIIPSWQLFLVAVAFFYFYSLRQLLNRYIQSLNGALLALILYVALFNIIALSGIRQCITTGIAFLLIPLINDRRWKVTIPIILLGATIHISLLFILLLIPLIILNEKTKRILYLLAIVLIPAVAIGARSIVTFMVGFLSNEYYAGYADADKSGDPIVYVAICSFISIYEYFNYKKLTSNPKTLFLVPSNILMTFFVPLIFLDGTMIRIGQYFTLYIMLSLSYIFDKSKYGKIAYIISITALIFNIFTSNFQYYFFWENVAKFYY